MNNTKKTTIGCASAFWGDTSTAAAQLVQGAKLDYLVFDYLAEVTMSIMAGARMKNPAMGYAPDFITTLAPLLEEFVTAKIRVISNAGGINPQGCAQALRGEIEKQGLPLKVAVVEGDNLMSLAKQLADEGVQEMYTNASLPRGLVSINAYLGAAAITAALDAGADIVITGRGVDSAVVTGALVHEFGWSYEDFDKLAQASLAGHIIECGAQCSGGNFTDWETVPDYETIGFPFVEVDEDGNFVVGKADATGGLVSVATVAEQVVYEIGDPGSYYLPDVTCDFRNIRLKQDGDNRVAVSGAKGRPPTNSYKVSATYMDGFRCTATCLIGGIDAPAKARRVAEAILNKVSTLLGNANKGDFSARSVELLGTEATYGARGKRCDTREVVLKISVAHPFKDALILFSREIAQAATGMAPGLTGLVGGRPNVQPVIKLFSFLIDKSRVPVTFELDNLKAPVGISVSGTPYIAPSAEPASTDDDSLLPCNDSVRLIDLAWARSGDKGNHSNIGVIARKADYLPYIRNGLSEQRIAAEFAHLLDPDNGKVMRWEWPGINALNFLLENSLGGGGIASLRIDPQGKAFAQQLLDLKIPVPSALASSLLATGVHQ
ncbi:acyclic terpene utilization AtuA family protein [Aestuariirhabdus sp. LZHN29]|uniref:acyclic terpene utilization AtuA family protein n=1 Tax=Aestuariirhabdus sp. LZHN29 TaxID=3417462 RepID=UPI003CEC4AC0